MQRVFRAKRTNLHEKYDYPRFQQVGEERAFGVSRLVLGLGVIGRDARMSFGQQQPQVLDGARLADAGWTVGQCPGDAIAQAALDEIGKGLDRRRGDPVVAGLDGMQTAIDRARVRFVGRWQCAHGVPLLGSIAGVPRADRQSLRLHDGPWRCRDCGRLCRRCR